MGSNSLKWQMQGVGEVNETIRGRSCSERRIVNSNRGIKSTDNMINGPLLILKRLELNRMWAEIDWMLAETNGKCDQK